MAERGTTTSSTSKTSAKGFDASRTVVRRVTGTEHYAIQLISALIRSNTQHTITLYFRDPPPPDLFPASPRVEHRVLAQRRLWTHTAFAAALRGSLLALTAVATRIGRDDVAAHQIAFEIWSFLAMGMDALAIAAQALVGRYLGAGDQRSAREVSNRLLRLGLYASGAVAVLVAMSAPVVGRFFTPDGDVVELVGFLLLWVAVLQPLGAVAFVLDGVLIGAGDQRFLAWGMAAAAVALALAVAPVIPLGLGIGWVWASFGLLMVVRAVVLLVRFGGDRWMVVGASR